MLAGQGRGEGCGALLTCSLGPTAGPAALSHAPALGVSRLDRSPPTCPAWVSISCF